MSGLKKWVAFGSGVGIQVAGPRGSESLLIAAARVRPSGARLAGSMTIEDFPHKPAGVWGTEYTAFLRKLGLRQAVATVILPRASVIVRPLALPGVSNKDLDSAVRFQMDGLHPYNDEDVYSTWTRLPGTSTVLVAVARKDAVERYAAPFEEAGVRVGGFTCSAAAIYSALRLFGAKPAPELLAVDDSAGDLEYYGESPTRPVFSASFELGNERAAALAASELRVHSGIEAVPLTSLLSAEPALPFAAALTSACPHLSLALNLLPAERRQAGSRLRWAPSVAFGSIVLLLAGALAALPTYERRKYLKSLDAQIAAVSPQANRAGVIDKQVDVLRRRIQLLDDLRRHPRADMDVLAELTHILAPPTWLNVMQISPKQVIVGGETPESAALIPLLDASRFFEASELQVPPTRLPSGEHFSIKTNREGVK
jgi:hypothetical protein